MEEHSAVATIYPEDPGAGIGGGPAIVHVNGQRWRTTKRFVSIRIDGVLIEGDSCDPMNATPCERLE